jgi:hypothetical protein
MTRLSAVSVARPKLEQLEDRRLLAVTYHGGAVLARVEVEPVFYGPYWNSPAGQQQASDLDNFLSFLTNSSFMDMLNEYGIGRGVLLDHGIVAGAASSAASVDDMTLQQAIAGTISGGRLQPPDANRLFMVFTAPNVDVTAGGQDSIHNFYAYHDFFTGPGDQSVYYAVVAHPVGNGTFYNLSVFQTLTKTVSHELAETVTDPSASAWYDNRTGEEIGDFADGPRDIASLNGYIVQGVWSAQLRAVVLPLGSQRVDATNVSAKPLSTVLDQAANAFTHSDEYFANLVSEDYSQFLQRTPSAAEVGSWAALMKNGLTDEQLLAAFTSSPEYYLLAGGTDQSWVEALYRDVLGRAADQAGEAAWLQRLASGASRSNIASGFATSAEHESLVIAADYQHYLGRTASASEVAGWVNSLQLGMSDEQVVAAFAGSAEFYADQGGTLQGWLNGAYQLILQRAPDQSGFNYWQGYLQASLAGG